MSDEQNSNSTEPEGVISGEQYQAYRDTHRAEIISGETAAPEPTEPTSTEPAETKPSTSTAQDDDADDEAVDATSTTQEGTEPPHKKKLGGWQRKYLRSEEKAARLERELETYRSTATRKTSKPDPEHFDTPSEYTVAMIEYKLEERERAAAAKQAQEEFESRCRSYEEVVPRFSEVYESKLNVSDLAEEKLLRSPYAPGIALWSIDHPEEARPLSSNDPVVVERFFDHIEGEFQKAVAAQEAQAAQTPQPKERKSAEYKPAPKITGGAARETGSLHDEFGNLDYQAFRRAREQGKL